MAEMVNGVHLAVDAPARDVGEGRSRPQRFGQARQHREELLALEEAHAHVVLAPHRNVRLLQELSRLNRLG